MQGSDGSEALGQNAAGEEEKSAKVIDVKGIASVENWHCFDVYLPAGAQERRVGAVNGAEPGV